MNTWKTLVRREFWEHRGMWVAPLVVAGLLVLVATFGGVHLQLRNDPVIVGRLDRQRDLFNVTNLAVAWILLLMITITVFGYLLESLYGERKDRSILFWRSLPVSDTRTVLSKLLVGLGVMPLYGWLVVVVTHSICSLMLMLFTPGASTAVWSWGVWLHANLLLLCLLVAAVLWYAPVAGWLLLASAVARRSPFMYAFFPVAGALAMESVLSDRRVLRTYLSERMTLPFSLSRGSGAANTLDPVTLLTNPHLWLGLIAAAAMVACAIRLRRYRDDT